MVTFNTLIYGDIQHTSGARLGQQLLLDSFCGPAIARELLLKPRDLSGELESQLGELALEGLLACVGLTQLRLQSQYLRMTTRSCLYISL